MVTTSPRPGLSRLPSVPVALLAAAGSAFAGAATDLTPPFPPPGLGLRLPGDWSSPQFAGSECQTRRVRTAKEAISKHPLGPFAATALRRVAADLGLRTGFPTDADCAALQHVARYGALSRERIGDRRFERVYLVAIGAAERVACRLGHPVEPARDHRRVVGREFRFASSFAALRFKLIVDAAFAGQRPRAAEVSE